MNLDGFLSLRGAMRELRKMTVPRRFFGLFVSL